MSTNAFAPTSRYFGLETATYQSPGGRTITYLKRRFAPQREDFDLLQEHQITQGDRLDTLAAEFLGDPEQFWRLCDSNGALRPEELTDVPGAWVRITLPQGVSAPDET